MISEKFIYNTFLRISRSQSGLPFRLRKQWHGFEETEQYPLVLRLKNFFSRNQGVDMNEFFAAPYTVYPGESGFDLAFYSSPKAIKVYTISLKKKMLLQPDDIYHLEHISRGLKFIQQFCYTKKIPLEEYLKYKEGVQSGFVVHLKNRKISIYNLFAFQDFDRYLKENDPDLLRFTLGELYDQIPVFRTKYLGSTKAKILAARGLDKIKNNLKSS